MPSELKKPEPVAVVKVVMQGGNAGLSWYAASPDPTSALDILRDGTFLHTDAQLDQYAADRVREAVCEAKWALQEIAHMDPNRARADDLGRAARIAHDALRTLKEQTK